MLAEVTPLCCHCAGPPQPGGPCMQSGSQGHQKGHLASGPALLLSSSRTHSGPEPALLCQTGDCAGQLPGQPAPHSLHPTTCTPLRWGEGCRDPCLCQASCSARTPVTGHPSRDTRCASQQPTALPQWHVPVGSHSLCAGIQAWPRIPGHDHTSLGMATCSWGCNKHDPGHGTGSGPLLSPGIPGMSPPEGSLLGLQPSHRIRAGMVPGGLCWGGCAEPDTEGQGAGAPSPQLGLWSQPHGHHGQVGGVRTPQVSGDRSRAEAGGGAAPDARHSWGCRGPSHPQHQSPEHP